MTLIPLYLTNLRRVLNEIFEETFIIGRNRQGLSDDYKHSLHIFYAVKN